MQTNTYSLMCKTSIQVISGLIDKWWDTEELVSKEIITSNLPSIYSIKYRRGHLLGEASILVEFRLKQKGDQALLKIRVIQSDFARWSPKEELEKIVCWYSSSLKDHNIEFEMKPGLFQSVIEC